MVMDGYNMSAYLRNNMHTTCLWLSRLPPLKPALLTVKACFCARKHFVHIKRKCIQLMDRYNHKNHIQITCSEYVGLVDKWFHSLHVHVQNDTHVWPTDGSTLWWGLSWVHQPSRFFEHRHVPFISLYVLLQAWLRQSPCSDHRRWVDMCESRGGLGLSFEGIWNNHAIIMRPITMLSLHIIRSVNIPIDCQSRTWGIFCFHSHKLLLLLMVKINISNRADIKFWAVVQKGLVHFLLIALALFC